MKDELYRLTNKRTVNKVAKTFTFTSIDNLPVSNVKSWYNDPAMIGRHFLVFSAQTPSVKRHYTICSAMEPMLYNELLTLADCIL